MPRLMIILGAVLGALALAPVGSAATRLPVSGSGGVPFTALLPWSNVHGAKEKARSGKTVSVGHSTLAIEVAARDEYAGVVDPFDVSNRTAVNHAKYLAMVHGGWRATSADGGRRLEVRNAKKALQYLVFAAEAASPETFHVRLVKDGGDGQRLMRALDGAATRFWLGTQDPKTITSDPDGLALSQQVNTAVAATQQLTMTIAFTSDPSDDEKLEESRADGYVAESDANGLYYWRKGTTELDYDDEDKCWESDTVDASGSTLWSTAFLSEPYGLRVNAPTQAGTGIGLTYTGFSSNTAGPDVVVATIDPATHLPSSVAFQAGFVPLTINETLDWQTPIVEQPQPTGPLCSS